MTREYLAIYDNGHSYGDFTFSSTFRKGSKGKHDRYTGCHPQQVRCCKQELGHR